MTEAAESPSQLIMDLKEIESVIEGLLFVAGDPLQLEKIAEILDIDRKTAKRVMSNLISSYNSSRRGLMIREMDGTYQLCTRIEYSEYLNRLIKYRQRQPLSQAAMETLSIIAYNNPITKARIEQIRGVNSDSCMEKLLERNLICEAGRMEVPGRPILYETTGEFLKSFGLRSCADLPSVDNEGLELPEQTPFKGLGG